MGNGPRGEAKSRRDRWNKAVAVGGCFIGYLMFSLGNLYTARVERVYNQRSRSKPQVC
jgi:hypothetical protein